MTRHELAYALIVLSLLAAAILIWRIAARSRQAERATQRPVKIDLIDRRRESGQP